MMVIGFSGYFASTNPAPMAKSARKTTPHMATIPNLWPSIAFSSLINLDGFILPITEFGEECHRLSYFCFPPPGRLWKKPKTGAG
jgi:hypothetical protein